MISKKSNVIDFIIAWLLVYLIISLAKGEWMYEMWLDSDSKTMHKYALYFQLNEDFILQGEILSTYVQQHSNNIVQL